jgi:hypothetical protein
MRHGAVRHAVPAGRIVGGPRTQLSAVCRIGVLLGVSEFSNPIAEPSAPAGVAVTRASRSGSVESGIRSTTGSKPAEASTTRALNNAQPQLISSCLPVGSSASS